MTAASLPLDRRARVLIAAIGVGLLGLVAGWAAYSAFTSTTSNTGNRIVMGDVVIGDNDAGTFMYNESNISPDVPIERCITVTYTGSIDADVRLYASAVQALGDYIDLQIVPGTGSGAFPSCAGFAPAPGGPLFTGTLKGFADTYGTWNSGLATLPATKTFWANADAVVYRFTLDVRSDDDAQGLDTGLHGFTWEARNR